MTNLETLRVLQQEANLTVNALADILDKPQNIVSRMLNGNAAVSDEALQTLTDHLENAANPKPKPQRKPEHMASVSPHYLAARIIALEQRIIDLEGKR